MFQLARTLHIRERGQQTGGKTSTGVGYLRGSAKGKGKTRRKRKERVAKSESMDVERKRMSSADGDDEAYVFTSLFFHDHRLCRHRPHHLRQPAPSGASRPPPAASACKPLRCNVNFLAGPTPTSSSKPGRPTAVSRLSTSPPRLGPPLLLSLLTVIPCVSSFVDRLSFTTRPRLLFIFGITPAIRVRARRSHPSPSCSHLRFELIFVLALL
ncbi:hypothetical protein B0H16DRAFT_1694330 [Mycena metata]|uniref:Uncharacterized protein n=1 Tax=Mycena metata TaxID=1033252 RepID=A0AAD7IEC7_9AGAR|nr:hypothetical protein B0H16DRAFT_1694330 [Mycena metata]